MTAKTSLHRATRAALAVLLSLAVFFGLVTGSATADQGDPASIVLSKTTVMQYDNLWFDLAGFTEGESVVVHLVDPTGTSVAQADFQIGADGNTVNPDGQTYRRITVPRDAVADDGYVVEVRDQVDQMLLTSEPVTVDATPTRVFNPGDHDHGTEDLTVAQGGSWTFHAVAFRAGERLTATAVVGGETVVLRDVAQSDVTAGWTLGAQGDTTREVFTRVVLPKDVPIGDFVITFSDGVVTVPVTITVEAAPPASVTVAERAEMGGTLRVTGEGWIHPTNTEQGSRIAVKIDDGAYARADGAIHQNRTIWWIIDAEVDGTFEVAIPMPDGTQAGTTGSRPAASAGEHTLRLLTGSLLAGDVSGRTVKSEPFQLSGVSAPAKESTRTTAALVKKKITKRKRVKVKVVVRVPGSKTKPKGLVVVKAGKKKVATKKLKAKHKGKLTIKLKKLKRGKHKIKVRFRGNGKFVRSATRAGTLTVR